MSRYLERYRVTDVTDMDTTGSSGGRSSVSRKYPSSSLPLMSVTTRNSTYVTDTVGVSQYPKLGFCYTASVPETRVPLHRVSTRNYPDRYMRNLIPGIRFQNASTSVTSVTTHQNYRRFHLDLPRPLHAKSWTAAGRPVWSAFSVSECVPETQLL